MLCGDFNVAPEDRDVWDSTSGLYTWWRTGRAHLTAVGGLRIARILGTTPRAARCRAVEIDAPERKAPPSHALGVATLAAR